jgi:hypothetical protein
MTRTNIQDLFKKEGDKKMTKESFPIFVTLSKRHRDLLRKMAAEKNLMDPDQVTTAASLARDIIVSYLDNLTPQEKSQDERLRGI